MVPANAGYSVCLTRLDLRICWISSYLSPLYSAILGMTTTSDVVSSNAEREELCSTPDSTRNAKV